MKWIFVHMNLKWRLLGVLLGLSVLYGFWQHFFDGIQPIHECRKADSISQAMQFMHGAKLTEPRTHAISNTGHREAAAEFPIVYYVVGQLWKLIGFKLWYAKLLGISYLLVALVRFRKVLSWFFNSEREVLLMSGLIMSMPVLIYYADSLLPNVYAFSSLLLAASFFYQFTDSPRIRYWLFFTLFLSLAVLIKITAIIAPLSFIGASFFYRLQRDRFVVVKEKQTWWIVASFFVVLIFTAWWYRYAIQYNALYQSTIFSTTTRPIWEVDAATRWRIIDVLVTQHLREWTHPIVLIPLLFVPLVLWFKNVLPLYFKYWLAVSLLGLAGYFVLWFWVFDVHDYYLIEALFFPLTFFALAIKYREQVLPLPRIRTWIYRLALVVVFLNTISFTQIAAGNQNIIVKNTFLTSALVRGNWGWFYFNHREGLGQVQDQTYELQQVINQTDTVFCFSDPYPNVQLSTIDRVGFSGYGYRRNCSNSLMIRRWIRMGASKLLVLKADTSNALIKPYLVDQCYHKNNVFVYDLARFRKQR
jgi:hypothetical protein